MKRWAWALVLGVTLAVWAPALFYGWVLTWDDLALFVGNQMVRQWNWTWIVRTQYQGHWMPLTWVSASLNYALFGYNPMAWHAVNVGLHSISAVLVYFIARRLVGSAGGAVFAALLFSVHPLRMESVAWISERKDVLLGVFFLGAILLWMQGRRWWSFLAFVAACASKSPAVMLPVWLLALDWYRDSAVDDGRPVATRGSEWKPRLVRLAPFFAVSVIVSIAAFRALHSVLVELSWTSVGLTPRLWHMAYSEAFYIWQTVYPARLSALIEYTWSPSWNQPQYPIALAVVLGGALVCWLTSHRWPALTAAAVCYTVAILPQSGFFQNGPQLVANRYSYLACIPLALLAGGALTIALRRHPVPVASLATGALAALAAVTLYALPMWKDTDAMWQYAARHEPTCTQCLDMATAADVRHGDIEAALRRQRQAVAVSATTAVPRWERHFNLAVFLYQTGHHEEAAKELRVFLAAVPPEGHGVQGDREHVERARVALMELQRR